jgi:acetylornithine deacetylase/succinyl-diaminopimelate desuccinylase-like protein
LREQPATFSPAGCPAFLEEQTMSDHASQIDTFLQDHLDQYVQETAELCAQPSVSATGAGVPACASLVARILERHGFQVQRFETAGNPILVGRSGGLSERGMLLYNHYDVQPPEPLALWTSPPFEPVVRAGALYARGAADDKGEFIARLAALDALRQVNGGSLPCRVTCVLEGEEEIASPHIAQFVREHLPLLESDAAIWEGGGVDPQGRPGTTLGCRGVLSVELAVEMLNQDAHSGMAHMLPNAAWRLVRALHSLKDPAEHILIPGFYAQARPPSPRDLELLEALPDSEAWARSTFGVGSFVNGLTGRQLDRAVFNCTCNIDGLTAGYQGAGMKTVIPARATAKLDFRLVPDQDPDDIFAKLRLHLDNQGFTDVSTRLLGAMWPYKAAADDPVIRLAARTAEEVYRQPYQIDPLAGGSSPIYAFAGPLGNIPVLWAGVGYADNRAHSPDEHVRLQDLLNGARHIARILDGFAGLEV